MRLRQLACATALALAAAAPSALLAQDPPRDHTGVWWNAEESGWGVFTVDYGNVLAPTWYTYDEDGNATWFLVTGALPQDDGSYLGDLYRFTGVPFAQLPYQPDLVQGTKVGSARFTFSGDDALSMTYTVGTVTQTKQLSRFAFGEQDVACHASEGSRADASNYTDLWWNPAQNGWGLNLTHVGDNLFVTWYSYGEDGKAVWFLGVTSLQQDGSFRGTLFRGTEGTPFLQIDGEPILDGVEDVGEAAFAFSDGETGVFTWTVGELTQSRDIERLVAGANPPVCETVEPPPPDERTLCLPELKAGDLWRDRVHQKNDAGEYVPNLNLGRTRIVLGTETFDGATRLAVGVEHSIVQGVLIGKEYMSQSADERLLHGETAIDPNTGAVAATAIYEPAASMPRRFLPGEVVTQEFEITGPSYSSTEQRGYKLLGVESVTVPAGTFEGACKLETTRSVDEQAGNTHTEAEITATEWWHPQFGFLRSEFTVTGTSTVGSGAPTSLDEQYRREIIRVRIDGVAYP